jgi:hypothetical protein
MSEPELISDTAAEHLGAEAVRQLGLARGFSWTLEEARAIRDQLVSTQEGLRLAQTRVDATAEEPAITFDPDHGARRCP